MPLQMFWTQFVALALSAAAMAGACAKLVQPNAAEALNYAVAATDYYGHTIHPFQLLSFAILVV